MKSKFWLICLFALAQWLWKTESANCDAPFLEVPYGTGSYCAKCDTTCDTCSGSSINQCRTCPIDFTLNTNTCNPPISTAINTVANSYHSFGFIAESSWPSSTTFSCGGFTILQPTVSTNSLITTHKLGIHYQVRIRVAFWSLSNQTQTLGLTYSNLDTTTYSASFASPATVNSAFSGQTYTPTCTGAYAVNYQQYINDSNKAVANAQVEFSSSASSWGINQYIFIEYLCSQPDCASCVGPGASNCTSCSSSIKTLYNNPGPCLCNFALGYYAYPTGNTTYYCVNPCPNLPSGQYYGDNFTKDCLLTCPANSSNTGFWNLSFASDQYGFCVNQCPATITLAGTIFDLYYDLVGRKCTTQCPSAQPYANPAPADRACYSSCPVNSGVQFYMLKTAMTCVAICPNITNSSSGVQIPLYRDPTTLTCVPICISGYWGFTNASSGDRYCIINECPAGSGQFTDNSTGKPLCTITCAAPNWFGDYYISPPACVTTCSFPNFGDQNSTDRFCVPKCNNSFYGIQSGTRQCVKVCPSGSWGDNLTLVCVTAPFQCNIINITYSNTNLTGNFSFFDAQVRAFADNMTNMCIWANDTCSSSMLKLNSSKTCELSCPNGTYANNITFWCVDRCYGLYFSDPLLNRCVLTCSPGLYADIGSGNTCVTRCNQTGGFPFRDTSTRQCVSVCNNGYADPTAQLCTYNCTPGLYLNGTDSSNQTYKVCASNCSAPYFAYNNTDSGICLMACPKNPPLFGDVVSGLRICVEVCQVGYFGDQVNSSYRYCITQCQNGTFAQNDSSRLCVIQCNSSTYGRTTDWTCVDPLNCPDNYTGDPTTNLCVNWCPPSNGTFSDNISKLCVSKCPTVNGTIYYADIHIRWCIPTCIAYNSSVIEFGNNSTQTCQQSCLDNDSFADAQSPRRYCIALCTNTNTTLYYRNNYTMTCLVSTACTGNDFADNYTAYCVEKCSLVPNTTNTTNSTQTWGYIPTKTCVALCYPGTFGDLSTGIPLCVSLCPAFPVPKWSYLGPSDNMSVMLCMTVCPPPYFGQDFLRTCVTSCPLKNSSHQQTYSYDVTRRCLLQCPNNTFADYIAGICYHYSINCTIPCWYSWTNCSTYRWADPYNNSCTYLCTASPWDTYGDNATQTCTTNCSVNSYADNYTGTRTCIAQCPGYYDAQGVVNSTWKDINNESLDSYGDNFTQKCVKHCVMPNTYADWQTHLCTLRCSGDLNTSVPTYSNIFTNRCVIALFCPVTPDLYFGQNITRWCLPACPLNVSFADNLTRTCIPVCYQYNYASSPNNLTTRFYGDKTTGRPACVVACSVTPPQFGRNDTNLCVDECPNYQYGDQTGNRSCVAVCPSFSLNNGTLDITWFSQLTSRICVTVCENGTWGNYYNSTGPHCETVGTDCKLGQFGDNSTHLCVDVCPESMNYFGDPSTRLCTDRCPFLNSSVFNATANINLTAGRLFADYKTRICIFTCPADFGLQGTFGDNSTNTCVERCPLGSYGDASTVNRFCVAVCTNGGFADSSTMLCVDICPASPPTYGYSGNWTCVKVCPDGLWADSLTRTCTSSCNPDFRFSLTNECVGTCPSDPDLYADTNGYNCTPVCTLGQFADPTDRTCKINCTPLFQYNYRCVSLCPLGFFANSSNDCVLPKSCQSGTYGDNSTTKCVSPCPDWSFADDVSGYCIAICPAGTYGEDHKCVSNCSTTNTSFSNITQMCVSKCPNGTFSYQGACVTNCSNDTYQNEVTRICGACPNGLFADPNSHRCVVTCPYGWYRQTNGANSGRCVPQNNGCMPQYADFHTGNCLDKCSTGFWGFRNITNSSNTYVGNYTCLSSCPAGLYGYENLTQTTPERTCYPPNGVPGSPTIFVDTVSGMFVLECPQTPVLYYGDRNRQLCVSVCQSYNITPSTPTIFYGDPQSRQCESTCKNATYTADNFTRLCSLRCTYGSFRFNDTPVCTNPCPTGYGDYTTRICVSTCPIGAGTYGYHFNTTRICLSTCPSNYFSEPLTRTCTTSCPHATTPYYYAYNNTRECLLQCKSSFAFDDTFQCVSQCSGTNFPLADNSTNKCVPVCPSKPDYYGDSNVCVFFCTTAGYFADSNGRLCVSTCTNTSTYIQYGDPRTGKCEKNCSYGYWGDNNTNLCTLNCSAGSYADNTTGVCVKDCPKDENIYADPILRVCAYTCSGGYFGSQVNQTCIPVCDDGYWGDPTTTICTPLCPVKIYSYGQNGTRTCVSSCANYSGYADNYSRLCRSYCQHTLTPQTYISYSTAACVEKCPFGTWAANHTSLNNSINQCVTFCPSGFADNYSQWCVSVCPSDPQSYGDTHSRICIYSCRFGQFSDNSTNLCVVQCPSLSSTPAVDYYGDNVTGRCVLWCTEGTYAQNSSRLCVNPCDPGEFADNLTRRCITNCPPSEATFADSTTHRCVRICPQGWWAENSTQSCVPNCWTYTNASFYPIGTQSYADNLTNFCVAQCPFGYFGTNTTHKCVTICPASLNEYGHPVGRVCVGTDNSTNIVDCYGDNFTNNTYYGDPISRLCVQKCPFNSWADTHLFKCVTHCDSAIPEFRNNHTQMCVKPCPSDPDEFGDSSTGNCVRTCPSGSYAYTGNRTCVPSCGEFALFADNTTNRCVAKCATKPYLYADNHTWTCVFHCSDGQFADNRSQTCVTYCPSQWAYFGETSGYTCVSLCPPSTYADTNMGRTCQPTCSNSQFADNYTSSCVQHCRFVRPFWYEDTSSGSGLCVHVCPGQSYAYNPDQTCKYQDSGTLASTCPGVYYADRGSRQCVKFCPNGTFANINTKYCETTCGGTDYADPILRKCMPSCSGNLFELALSTSNNVCRQYCPYPYFAQNSSGATPAQCVTNCSTLGLESTRTCEGYCHRPYFADWTQHLCILNCTPNYQYVPNRTCLSTCQYPYYGNPINFTCDLLCPSNYFGRNDTRMCDTGCPSSSYADSTIRICVTDCPSYPPLFADSRFKQCLSFCSTPLFGYEVNMSCITSCPNITQGNRTLIYLADASNRLCVLSCVNAVISFADYTQNQCTQFCPNGTFASNYTKECVSTCPNDPNDTFSDNTSHICMDVCLPGSYGMSSKLNCVAQCWWPFYADPTTRRCVDFCPLGYFAQNSTARCRPTCPPFSYADPVTHRCLAQCPAQQFYFNYAGNWTCLLSCPTGFFANTDSNSCQSICNSSTGMFAYLPTNLCVRECPIPYRGYAPNYTCVLSCPAQYYFYDVTINVCAQCDPTCVVCSSLATCLQCQSGYNLFNGYCSRSCIPTNGVVTYADPSGVCVTVCPSTYFGVNTSYSCNQTCPQKQYGDPTTHLCQNCPALCASCSSLTLCLSCEAAATLAIDKMCYSDCNATFKYSYNNTCYNTCPAGTYLTYTGVTCTVCAPICLTCFGSGTACTSCATTYFFNSTCLTTCPSGYYGSTTLQCLTCSGSSNAACSNPLNFSTTFSTQNFKPVITLQFNQNVTMSKNISEILQINLQLKRRLLYGENERLLTVGSLVNNGITYTYQILSNGTIKLYPQVDVSLISPTFSVTISDPASVTSSATGVSLQNVQSLLTIAALEYYPPSDGIEAGTNFPAKLITVLTLVLYAITFVFSDVMVRPLQMLQILLFHCLIAAGVPANLYYFLFQAKDSTLDFVQNWFKGYLPAASPYYDTPFKVADVFVDQIFLRHLGQLFVLSVILGCFWFVFLILGNKRITTHKVWQGFFEKVSQKRYQLMVLNDVFSLFYFPILCFAFMQLPHVPASSGFYAFNYAVTIILLLVALIIPFAWWVLWKVRTPEEVENKLWFLTIRAKQYNNSGNVMIHDERGHEHIRDKSSVNSGDFKEEALQKNPHQLQGVIFYGYQLLMAVWIVALYAIPKAQLALLIITNLCLLFYQLKARPHLNTINLIFTVLFILFLITVEAFYLYFLKNPSMTATQKTNTAFPLLITADVFCVLMVLWVVWRFVWEASYYWNSFKKTQLYLEFADHDYVGEAEQTEKYSVYEKKAEKMAVGLGDLVIDEIIERVGPSGEKIIAVKKRRLRKKQKVQGRKKFGELIPEEEISSREEFVRVNNFNIFDYDERQFEQEIEKSEPEPEVVRPKRNIDDDLRDIISDNSEQIPRYHDQEEEKKIEVQAGEELISNLDSMSAIEEVNRNSEKISEYPFLSVEMEEHEEEEKMGEDEVKPQQEYYKYEEHSKKQSPRRPAMQDNEELYSKEVKHQQKSQKKDQQQSENNNPDHSLGPAAFQELKSERSVPQQSINLEENLSQGQQVALPTPKIKNLEDLLQEQENPHKKKNLLFLFDDFEEEA